MHQNCPVCFEVLFLFSLLWKLHLWWWVIQYFRTETAPLDVYRLSCLACSLVTFSYWFPKSYGNLLREISRVTQMGICYLCGLFLQVSSSLLTHTLIHSAVSVWLGERHHSLAMWPHNAPGMLTWHAHSCSVSSLTLDSLVLVLFYLLFNTPLASERGTEIVPLRNHNTADQTLIGSSCRWCFLFRIVMSWWKSAMVILYPHLHIVFADTAAQYVPSLSVTCPVFGNKLTER
jgi:hypothetical protein